MLVFQFQVFQVSFVERPRAGAGARVLVSQSFTVVLIDPIGAEVDPIEVDPIGAVLVEELEEAVLEAVLEELEEVVLEAGVEVDLQVLGLPRELDE